MTRKYQTDLIRIITKEKFDSFYGGIVEFFSGFVVFDKIQSKKTLSSNRVKIKKQIILAMNILIL